MSETVSAKRLSELQRFQYLIEGISDYAIYMLDPQGKVSSWNAGAQRFKGYADTEVLGRHFSHFYTPEDQAAGLPQRALAVALAEGKYESEGWRVRKDGSRFWAHVVIDPIYDEAHALVGFAKITRDITARKQAEDALRDSEQRFRLLVQGVTDYAIYMLSPEGRVTNWNAGAERIKGYTYDEIVGSHVSRFYTDEDRAAGTPERALAAAAAAGRYEHEGWRVRKDGSRFWAHAVIDAVHGDDGRLIGFAKITRDLTENKAAEEALAEANAALFQAQKMESIGQLTGGVAHDFNNLLSVLSSGVELLSMGRHAESEAKTLDSMRRAIDRGARLTQQLLAFARQQPLTPQTRNVNRLITSFEPVLRRATNPAIRFETALAAQVSSVLVDAARFESALLNLVVNARDAMPNGGLLVIASADVHLRQDEVRGLPPGAYVRVTVRDTGTGMTEATRARAFEPFFTTKEVGKGSGLGLSQVYGFIKQSGGEVLIDSAPGLGTTMSVYLPAVAPAHAESEAATGAAETVLIVEDERDLMDVASMLFTHMGYAVATAGNAQEAIQLLGRRPIDILFTDVIMPNGMDGIALAKHARARHPSVKTILASGYPLPALREKHAELSEFTFVNKPYRLADLARALRSAH